MGAAQSYVTSEAAVTVVLVAGAIGYGYTQVSHGSSSTSSTAEFPAGDSSAVKKGKKKKQSDAPSSELASTPAESRPRPPPPPALIPGGFDTPTISTPPSAIVDIPPPKNKKSKKKKKGKAVPVSTASGPAAPDVASTAGYHSDSSAEHQQPKAKRAQKSSPSSSQLARTPAIPSTISIDTDGSWTRVGPSRRKQSTAGAGTVSTSDGLSGPSADPTSDAGVTTSVTGNSSPVAERTEDEGLVYNIRGPETRRPLAERLLPKPRKTGVDDMLETPDYPTVSRVIRVQPPQDEKPASGFSWDDYEDVHTGENAGEGNEADGEDDGWGVVKSKRTRSRAERPVSSQVLAQKAPETLTKRQRQNADKRESQKAAKAEGEAERLATLAKHKRELEQARMSEQFGGKSAKGKTVSGGMKATVDEGGKLVWE